MSIQRKFIIFLILIVVLIALFFSGILSDFLDLGSSKDSLKVKITEARVEKLNKFIGASGSSEPSRVITLFVPSSVNKQYSFIKIEEVNTELGDIVKEGELLAKLSSSFLDEEVSRARKDLNDLKSGINFSDNVRNQKREYFNSIQSLYDKGFADRIELESARSALGQAEVNNIKLRNQAREKEAILKQLSNALANLDILSPIEGVVIEKEVQKGQTVSLGSKLFSIGANIPLNVIANVSLEDVNDLNIGQKAEVSFNYMPEIIYEGKVIIIYPSVDLDSQTTKVVISLDNDTGKLTPGLLASVRFKSEKEVLVVPKLSVLGPNGENNVFVFDEKNNKVYISKVITGQIFLDGKIEIIEGLSKGEKVVISNIERLEDGMSVKISQN